MSRSVIRNLLLGSAVALASAQVDSLVNMDLTTAEAVPTSCTAAQMSSIYTACLNQCEPAPANAIIPCDDVQTRFQIFKCAAQTERCNGQAESGVVKQAQANRLKEVCKDADSFRVSDVTLVFASAADVANSLAAQSQIEQLTLNAQALNGANSTSAAMNGMSSDFGANDMKRGIKLPGPRGKLSGGLGGGLYGSDIPAMESFLGPPLYPGYGGAMVPPMVPPMAPPMVPPMMPATRPKRSLFSNNASDIIGLTSAGGVNIDTNDIIGLTGPGGISIEVIDDSTGIEISTNPFPGLGDQQRPFGASPLSPRKIRGFSGKDNNDLFGVEIENITNERETYSVNFSNGNGRPGVGKPDNGVELGVGSGIGMDSYQVDLNGKGGSKGVESPGKVSGQNGYESGVNTTNVNGVVKGSGFGQDIGTGYEQGAGSGTGKGVGFVVGNGFGSGVGTGPGQGVGTGSGQGVGTGSGQGVGAGSGQGVGTGSGQGVGTGSGQGVGTGVGKGIGSGSGQGFDFGSGVGNGFGSGVGIGSGQGFGSGMGSGSGQGFGLGVGIGQSVGSSYGSGEGVGEGTGTGSGSGRGSNVGKGSGFGDGKGSGSGDGKASGKGAGVKEYTWKQTGTKKASPSVGSSPFTGSPTIGNGTSIKGYNTTKFHTTNSSVSKPNSVAKLAGPALSAVVFCAFTAFFSF